MKDYKSLFSPQVKAFLSEDEWLIAEKKYDRQKNLVYESLFTLCSGKMSSRGAHEEGFALKSLPAHYLHGVFDRSEAFQRELVNTPDWAKLKIYHLREPIALETGRGISDYIRVLDLKHGILAKHYVHEDIECRKTRIEVLKLLSREHPRCGCLRFFITPLNYAGIFEFENVVDATVTNFMDYPRFRVKHLNVREVDSPNGDGCAVLTETRDFLQAISTQTAVRVFNTDGTERTTRKQFRPYGEVACEFFDVHLANNETVVIDKFAAVAAEKDGFDVRKVAASDLKHQIRRGFVAEAAANRAFYVRYWEEADLQIVGDEKMQKAMRFNIFHLMSTPNPDDNMTNIGAKLLHGEEYGGHAFWDTEIFILPFFSLVFPDQARNLVEYRYHMLPGAKRNARLRGGTGARYPWESADTGDEECPDWTIEWDGTATRCTVAEQELHVTADVIYGGLQYYNFTGDVHYHRYMLLEMMIETSRFWISRLEWNEEMEKYELTGVTGPDEWHEDVANSYFTNYMTRWSLRETVAQLEKVAKEDSHFFSTLSKKMKLNEREIAAWQEAADKIYLPAEKGLLEQFSGYFDLHHAEIDSWNEHNMPLMPSALKGYPKKDTCIIKQADIVMLLYLFQEAFDEETQYLNYDYYEKRTLHGSSLSPSVYCLMGLHVGEAERAYGHLERSAYIDLEDKHRNTREGLHAAAAAGSWQCVVFGFAGLHIADDGTISLNPRLPEHWEKVSFKFYYRGQPLYVEVTADQACIYSKEACEFHYSMRGKTYRVEERLPK